MPAADILARIPPETLAWLLEPDNPAVAALARRSLLSEAESPELGALWARRNTYEPIARILEAMRPDGSWAPPARDYQKYGGSLWQVHFLGELHADGADERVHRAVAYAFSRQLADGSWSCNGRPSSAIPCLTANVARALARLGFARDERVVHALAWIAEGYRAQGYVGCPIISPYTLNGYCHMLAPKLLLFLGVMPRDAWPDGAGELRDACVGALRDRRVFRCLPKQSAEYYEAIGSVRAKWRTEARERFHAEHGPLEYGDKPGWLRFGYPLSYNSDALEALAALSAVGERRRPEYEPALEVVEQAADAAMRWTLRNTYNGKTIAKVEAKGAPSKWLTLRSLQVLEQFRS